MLQPVEHGRKRSHNAQPTDRPTVSDEELLEHRSAILAEQRWVQARCRRVLDRLTVDYVVTMRALRWPLGCVVRPRRTA